MARRRHDPQGAKIPQGYDEVRTIEDHSAFFWGIERLPELDFLLDEPRLQRLEELPNRSTLTEEDNLAQCVNELRRAGCRVAYAVITTPDLAHYNLHVVRTLATGLQPIHFGDGLARLGGSRLYDVPRGLGHSHRANRDGAFNPCPHPLA